MNPVEQGSGSDAPVGCTPGTRQGGLVTLLFTDLVGSTALKQSLGDHIGVGLVQEHHALARALLKHFPTGEEISTAGDSFFIVFVRPSDAVRFALALQSGLQKFNQGRALPLQDRVGLHLGEVVIEETGGGKRDLHGMQVDTCARVMSLAQAGQILMTRPVFDNARQSLRGEEIEGITGLEWLNHGRFELKGVSEPVEICEVRSGDAEAISAPATSEKAKRVEFAEGEAVLGWRPAVGQTVPNTQWELEKKLGEGGFGEVWLGRHQKLKERRVFKFCFRADRVRSLKREMTLFRLIKERIGEHPNIVALREVYFEQPPYYVEEDYVAGHDLARWCAAQGGVEQVPLEVKLEIVAQVADALQAAHDSGVMHRDVKPGNILVGNPKQIRNSNSETLPPETTSSAPVPPASPLSAKLTDFGIGRVISEEALAGVTRAGFTQTMLSSSSSHTGTQLYMAPELLAGKPATTRSDIYSLGVVLYQLLAGDFGRAVAGDWSEAIADPLLREDLTHCLAGKPEGRLASAAQLARNLRSLPQRKAVLAEQQAAAVARQRVRERWKHVRTASAVFLIAALGLSLAWFLQRNNKVRRARESVLPQIHLLAQAGSNWAAFRLAREAERYIPNDPALANLLGEISDRVLIETTPEGADVYCKDYRAPDSPWEYLGKSPLKDLQLPKGLHRFQVRMQGYATVEKAAHTWRATNRFTLDPVGFLPTGMIRAQGGETGVALTGMENLPAVRLDDYLIDEFEVSNRRFKEFLDAGGYASTNHWKHPFVKQGKTLTWAEAMADFRDSTGLPGPATWKNGTYPENQADYPVTGISWYEAAAYADFVQKRLPSIYHWSWAAGAWFGEFIIPLSNFSGKGSARAGSYNGVSWCGARDMAGNVKEWTWNEVSPGRRYILGGGWAEPAYMFSGPDAQPAFDRSPSSGFRCMRLLSTNALPQVVDAPAAPAYRDYTREQPASDEVFQIWRSLFTYDKTDLKARVEGTDDSTAWWRKERVSLAAAYGDERLTLYLLLPTRSKPPFQAIIYFPGSHVIHARSSQDESLYDCEKCVPEQGRALIYPVYKGTFERGDGLRTVYPAPTSFYRDHVIQWSKDLGRTIDYLETRKDIQSDRLAYLGLSWGAALGAILPALESRLKASVLVAGGFFMEPTLREVDQLNFAPHVSVPTLMINGRYDFFYPVESSQNHMFRLLGTAPENKVHIVLECGHSPPKPLFSKEMKDWFDRFLGPAQAP